MMKIIFSISFILFTGFLFAQKENDDLPETLRARLNSTQAEFPGGPEKMKKFIDKHKRYANKDDEHFKVGIVYVNFIVEKDGSIDSVKLTQPLTEYYNNEALRLIKSMPKWKPATQNGKPVRTQFNFPVKF
jgi:protein TonB